LSFTRNNRTSWASANPIVSQVAAEYLAELAAARAAAEARAARERAAITNAQKPSSSTMSFMSSIAAAASSLVASSKMALPSMLKGDAESSSAEINKGLHKTTTQQDRGDHHQHHQLHQATLFSQFTEHDSLLNLSMSTAIPSGGSSTLTSTAATGSSSSSMITTTDIDHSFTMTDSARQSLIGITSSSSSNQSMQSKDLSTISLMEDVDMSDSSMMRESISHAQHDHESERHQQPSGNQGSSSSSCCLAALFCRRNSQGKGIGSSSSTGMTFSRRINRQ
jgi:hypothetical protein